MGKEQTTERRRMKKDTGRWNMGFWLQFFFLFLFFYHFSLLSHLTSFEDDEPPDILFFSSCFLSGHQKLSNKRKPQINASTLTHSHDGQAHDLFSLVRYATKVLYITCARHPFYPLEKGERRNLRLLRRLVLDSYTCCPHVSD